MAVAFLFHGISWDSNCSQIELSNNIKLCCSRDSNLIKLYTKLCHQEGCDYSEPFDYEVYAIFDDKSVTGFLSKEPISPISFLSSVIVLCLKEPIGMCRKIYSNDNFKSSQWTDLEYEYSAQTHEFLSSHKQYSMTDTNLIEMQKCYSSLWSVWTIKKIESPIIFAISFYYNAWTSHYLEQSGVNLSIMLESLFAPLSNTELSHQIAYNFCWFIGTDIESRRRLYSFCKKFYSLRSKIVHGNVPDQNELVTLIPEMFRHCSDVLKKILLNEELLHIFDDKKKKDEFFKKNIFNHSP